MLTRKQINRLKRKSLSDEEIFNALKGRTNIFLYGDILGATDIDELFGDFDSAVILYEKEPKLGHWVALLRRGNRIEFFDPYGIFPDLEKSYLNRDYLVSTGQNYNKLADLLYHSWNKYVVEYNNFRLQTMKDGVSTCGRHVIARIWNKKLSINQYYKLINSFKKKFGLDADDVVAILTRDV